MLPFQLKPITTIAQPLFGGLKETAFEPSEHLGTFYLSLKGHLRASVHIPLQIYFQDHFPNPSLLLSLL